MNILLISYLIMCISSFICVLIGRKLINPRHPLFIILCYLGFIAFFFGRLYEVSTIILGYDVYNNFELGFVGIIGAFSFWLSSLFAVKDKIKIKTNKSIEIKSLIMSCLVGLLYFIILLGNVTNLEKIIDLIVVIYACSVVYYYTKTILLINEDKSIYLKGVKTHFMLGIVFSILILLLAMSFSYGLDILILSVSILISITLIAMMISFNKGVTKWLT